MIFAVAGLSTAGWLKTYGTERQDYLEDGVHIDDGGYMLVGYTQTTTGDFDVWCLWLDENGDEVDSRTYGGIYNDKAHGVAKIDDGFIIVGETNSYGRAIPGYSNYLVIRIDSDGDVVWQYPSDSDTTIGGEYDDGFYRVIYIPAESICVAVGQYWQDFSEYRQEPLVFTFNPYSTTPSGNLSVITTGSGTDEFCDVDFYDGTIFACGNTKSLGVGTPAYSNGYLAALDLDLNVDLDFTFGGDNNDKFYGIKYYDGKIYLVGETASFDVDMTDVYAVCYSLASGTQWEQIFGGIYTDVAKDVAIVDGAMFILGKTNSTGSGYDDFYIIKADTSDGSEILERTYGGTGNDWASSIIAIEDGLLLVGSSSSLEFDAEDWDGMVVNIGFDGDTVSGIAESRPESPYILSAYPNPFNSSCAITVSYSAGVAGNSVSTEGKQRNEMTLKVYDLRGNVVWERSPDRDNRHREMSPTSRPYIYTPDQSIASGIYFVRAWTEDGGTITKRIIYLK